MTVNKSELMKKAWCIYKASIEEGDMITFGDALTEAWIPFKKAVKKSIIEVSASFWTTWKNYKESRYSRTPGQRNFWETAFDSVCKDLRSFNTSELKNAFGKYFDFVSTKIA